MKLKFFVFFVLSYLFSVTLNGQSVDSLDFDDYDSMRNHAIGFSVGLGSTFSPINPLNSANFQNYKSSNQWSYNVGMSILKSLKKGSFESGFYVNSTKIKISYLYLNQNYENLMSYFTLSLPLLYTNLDSAATKKWFYSAGLVPVLDITKKSDKELRPFNFRNFNLGLMVKYGIRIKGFSSFYEMAVFSQFYPMNLLKNQSSIFNRSLSSVQLINAGFQFTIR